MGGFELKWITSLEATRTVCVGFATICLPFKSCGGAGMIGLGSRRGVGDASRRGFTPAVIDGQAPCSEGGRYRVRLETEQPTCFIQVPWIAWSSMTAGKGVGDC